MKRLVISNILNATSIFQYTREMIITNEPSHAKTGLTIFVVVIPKESLADLAPAKPCFGMTTTKIVRRVLHDLAHL